MRIFACISLIAAFSLTIPGYAAAPQAERSMSEIEVHAPVSRLWYMNPQQLSEVRGTYALSNGQLLRITHERGRLYADLNRRGATELVPVAENMFVSADRAIAIEYKPIAFGDELVLSYRTAVAADAQAGVVTVHLALNR